jgi:hypothetical protein
MQVSDLVFTASWIRGTISPPRHGLAILRDGTEDTVHRMVCGVSRVASQTALAERFQAAWTGPKAPLTARGVASKKNGQVNPSCISEMPITGVLQWAGASLFRSAAPEIHAVGTAVAVQSFAGTAFPPAQLCSALNRLLFSSPSTSTSGWEEHPTEQRRSKPLRRARDPVRLAVPTPTLPLTSGLPPGTKSAAAVALRAANQRVSEV